MTDNCEFCKSKLQTQSLMLDCYWRVCLACQIYYCNYFNNSNYFYYTSKYKNTVIYSYPNQNLSYILIMDINSDYIEYKTNKLYNPKNSYWEEKINILKVFK